jgi:hypothetical protein
MTIFQWTGFSGENRAIHPKLLSEKAGTLSLNQKPGRGDLRPWKSPSQVATVPSGRQTIYRMGRDVASDSQYWLSWTGTVHAVLGFDTTDTTERTYYTGDGIPKVTYNTSLDGVDPQDNPGSNWRPLGIPAPSTPCTMTASGGVGTVTESYFYVYTYVNDWGWESAPSPVSLMLTRLTDDTTTITGFSTVPAGNYNVNRIRIYRTQTASSGSTDFFFLREIAYGTVSTTDDNRALGEVIPTVTWLEPPANLSNLKSLWNGMLAGISENSVRFCEPYVPYAWPVAYDVVPPDSKPVGLGVFGQSLLVLTTARPVLVSGSSPDSMDQQMLEIPQGCVSSKSIVSMGTGVAWASDDGLCWFGSGGARILTAGLMLREDWQALVPSSIIGKMYEGLYFGSYDDGSGRKGFIIDPSSPQGIFFLDTGYTAMHFDELKDQLYVLDGVNIKKWDAGSLMTVKARSKVFHNPKPINFSAAEVLADSYPLTLRVYANGVLKHTQSVANNNPFRLPSGFLAQSWQMEIEGTSAVQSVAIATAVTELASI